jgi:CubicO group peptidase (beta-lactamase class C family)
MLALIAEKVSGRSYDGMLQTKLLDPLGLKETGVDHPARVLPRRASGYVPDGTGLAPAPYLEMSWTHGSGGMYSTVGDMQKWVQAMSGGRVLPDATVQKMWQADKGPYGYGWQVLASWPPAFGRPLVLHAGGVNGFATDLLYYPQERS